MVVDVLVDAVSSLDAYFELTGLVKGQREIQDRVGHARNTGVFEELAGLL